MNWSLLYLKYKDNLANFLRNRTDGSVEDMVQDTFLRAMRFEHTFNPDKASFKTWLFTIGKNIAQNYPGPMISLEQRVDDPKSASDTLTMIALHEVLGQVSQIPDPFREPLKLYMEGFSYKEIAHITQTNTQTVKTRIWRARTYLYAA